MTPIEGGWPSARSSAPAVYLRAEAKLEPLICRWPAWAHLIAPATHAMNVAFRHLPQLRSFVAMPDAHVAAAKDPALLGGPYVALQADDVPTVKRLIADTESACAELIEFASSFMKLNRRLQDEAKGHSLDEYYAQMPSALSGFAELVYDLNSHPHVKVLEEALYEGRLDNSACHELCLHVVPDTEREFFMGAPLVDRPARLFLKCRFDDEIVDELARLRIRPGSPAALSRFGAGSRYGVLDEMFTTTAPRRNAPEFGGSGVRVRYFGHACILIQTRGVSILLDPLTAWQRNDGEASLVFDDLPDFIDYVVITHAHHDHFHPEVLLQLRSRIGRVIIPRNARGNLADPSLKLVLQRLGFANISCVDPLEAVPISEGKIWGFEFFGEHAGLDVASKHCIAVEVQDRTFVLMVDSDCMDPTAYRHVVARLGNIDALFIGMECHGAPLSWLYGPLLGKPVSARDNQSRRLSGADCERAWRVVDQFRCERVFVYAMGQEPWLKHIMGLEYEPSSVQIVESDRFVDRCRRAGKEARRLRGCTEMLF